MHREKLHMHEGPWVRLRGLVVLLLSLGCYRTMDTGRARSSQIIKKSWAPSWILGLVPPPTASTEARCQDGAAVTRTRASGATVFMGLLTTGLYTPVVIEVTCAATGAAAAVGSRMTIADDPFEPAVQVLSPWQRFPDQLTKYFTLGSLIDKRTRAVGHQLYLVDEHRGDDWTSWTRANGNDAQPLDVVRLHDQVKACAAYAGCSFREQIAVMIPDSTLRAHREGYAVKVYAENGAILIASFPAAMVVTQLAATDSVRAELQRKAP